MQMSHEVQTASDKWQLSNTCTDSAKMIDTCKLAVVIF